MSTAHAWRKCSPLCQGHKSTNASIAAALDRTSASIAVVHLNTEMHPSRLWLHASAETESTNKSVVVMLCNAPIHPSLLCMHM